MSDEIKVSVVDYGENRNLMMRYVDPTTGKQVARSAGTRDELTAERAAAVWQDELNTGRYAAPSRITWADFRERYEGEKLAGMSKGSQLAYTVALDHVTRVLNPDRLARLTPQAMSRFVAKLRKGGMKPVTIAKHLRHINAALRWAERQGYMSKAPTIEMPKVRGTMKGRPITTEEYERMLTKVASIRPDDADAWKRLITGLWLSGLRIGEAVVLSWDSGSFRIDLDGRHPAFKIDGAGQKSGKAELCPITPDFAEWILAETPEGERVGYVFPLENLRHGGQFTACEAGRVLSEIGDKAGVVVDPESGKTASAHDLRRAFGTRWARKTRTPVLQRLMRHANIQTTMNYYVDLDADEVADGLWANHEPSPESVGNTYSNTAPR